MAHTSVKIYLFLEDRNILFSFSGKNELVNYIYVLAKFYIYQNKFISRNISIQGFINLLKKKVLARSVGILAMSPLHCFIIVF